MSDIKNNSGLPEQDKDQEGNQYSQAEGASTYWESGEVQSSYEEQVQSAYVNTDDPDRNNQDPAGELRGKQYELQQKKKSGKKALLATIIAVTLILLVSAAAYAFSDVIRNSVNLLLKSPRDYYIDIENKSAGSSIDKSVAYMNMSKKDENAAARFTANLSYDKETLSALLKTNTGMTISDLEAVLGISLDSIGFDVISANSSEGAYQKIGVNLNSIDILTGELFTDYALEQMLIRIPDLSPAYLKQSLDMSQFGSQDFDYDKLSDTVKKITADSTGAFAKRYVKLITEEIEDVELTKNEQLSVGDITVDANLLTVYFYPGTLKNIMTKALDEAKNDEYVLNLLPLFDISAEEFREDIDSAIEDIKTDLSSLPQDKKLMVMKVYVANNGSILGRELEIFDNNEVHETLGFFHAEQGNKGAYNFYLKDATNNISIKGKHIKENGAYTGSLTLDYTDVEKSSEFNVEYDGLKIEVKDGNLYTYGSLSITSYSMMGMDLVFEFDVKDAAQVLTIKLNMGKSSLVTLETSTKLIEGYTLPKPDVNAEVYDMVTEIDGYYSTMDIVGFISTLSDKLGIDLEGLAESLLPIY